MKGEQKETSGWPNIVTAVERCLTQQNNINIGTRSIKYPALATYRHTEPLYRSVKSTEKGFDDMLI